VGHLQFLTKNIGSLKAAPETYMEQGTGFQATTHHGWNLKSTCV